MSLRRPKAPEDQLLGNQLVPRAPRERPQPPQNPLAWLSDANKAMHAGGYPPPPSRMQPPEDQVGYVLVVAMVLLGIILTVVHGKGSPKHPHHWLQIIGLVVAVVTPVAIFRFANRFVTAIMVVVSAFLISLVSPPDNWVGLYYIVLISPLGYAFWLTRRQSKAARAVSGRGSGDRDSNGRSGNRRNTGGGRKPSKDPEMPTANRRYTPPKGPRERPKRSEVAAAPAEPTSRRRQRRAAAQGKRQAPQGKPSKDS
jgi:hypothetical protein